MHLLCGGAVVVFQHSTETSTQTDGAAILRMIPTSLDQSVVDSLVVSLRVVMLNVLMYRISEMLFTEDDHSIKALRFYRSDETLSEGVGLRRRLHPMVPLHRDVSRLRIPFTRCAAASLRW